MAAVDVKSDQVTNQDAVPVSPIKPNELEGRVRIAYFSYSSPASSPPEAASTIELCKLPIGARLIKGHYAHDGIGGSSGTCDIGFTGDVDRYADAAVLADSAGAIDFLDTFAENVGDALTEAKTLLLTTAVATFTASKSLRGWVLYVVD